MSVRGKPQPGPPPAMDDSVEIALARALVAASKIVAEDRDPTAAESTLIADAQARAEVAGVEVGAAFAGYRRHVEHRAQLAAEAARLEEARQQKEQRRRDWLGRPGRFRALPSDVRLLFHLSALIVPDASLRGSDLLAALDAARNELLLPEGERVVPYMFEAGLVSEAKRLRFTVDGVQRLGGPA